MELYENKIPRNSGYIYYRRPYSTSASNVRQQLNDGTEIYITGIPDGVSPKATVAIVPKDTVRRLYIVSNRRLDETTKRTIDRYKRDEYDKHDYPIRTVRYPCAVLSQYPRMNFYMNKHAADSPITTTTTLLEYRYLQNRHLPATVAYDQSTGELYRLALDDDGLTKLILLMPKNFVKTSARSGYLQCDDDVIVHIKSNFDISANNDNNNDNDNDGDNDTNDLVVSVINLHDGILKRKMLNVMSTLGFTNVLFTDDMDGIIGKDRYMTAVIGNLKNVIF